MSEYKYIKGVPTDVVKRFDNIHTITLRCPISDVGIKIFQKVLISNLAAYGDENNNFHEIPSIDMYNAITESLSLCRISGVEDTNKISIAFGCINSFKRLKYVSIAFTDSTDVLAAYCKLERNEVNCNEDQTKLLSTIYSIDVLELNLSNMFSQDIIDIYNKSMIVNGLMSNSYLKRDFYMKFGFDDYVTYIGMLIENNIISFDKMDKNIAEYFRLFPTFIEKQKPMIIISTNYREL